MVIFQYNLYIFIWIQQGCLTNTVYAMDPNNSVIKRLCIFFRFQFCALTNIYLCVHVVVVSF